MNLSNSFFGKNIYELKVEDLQQFFITEKEETSLLEFKSQDLEPEKIHKEVCAFLNTEGGMLIIGAPKEPKPNTGKCIGSLTPSYKYKTVDIIIQSIASNISPSPVGIKGKHIDLGNGMIHVLEIPQSQTPPHQVNGEGKYYIRLEKEAKPAPHGIVEALFNKRQKPQLRLNLSVGKTEEGFNKKLIDLSLVNETEHTAENPNYVLEVKGNLATEDGGGCIVLKTSDGYRISNPDSNMPLVKGLGIKVEVYMTVRSRYLLVSSFCWCKDSIVVSKLGVYDCKIDKFIIAYVSGIEKKKNSQIDVLNKYDELKDFMLVEEE
jgi:predicted nucleic acid-binding Zn finger protein